MRISITDFLVFVCLAASVSTASSSRQTTVCPAQERELHPILCDFLQRKHVDSDALAQALYQSALRQGWIVNPTELSSTTRLTVGSDTTTRTATARALLPQTQLPVVFAHGMGDSCFNSGMQHITEHVSDLLNGVYTVCIPTGANQAEDTNHGYFLNMDASVAVWAEQVRNNTHLQNGFHAIGFSQGNNLIRGYMQQFNDPAVHTFVSVNGVNAGEGAVPYCRPSQTKTMSAPQNKDGTGFDMCDLLMEQASRRAYTSWAQEHLFQANYWRDPRETAAEDYYEYSQLARWNQEGPHYNERPEWKDNYLKTQQFVWIMATEDGMVWPREGEQWGAPDPSNPFEDILSMNETEWYQKDSFGLRTAQDEGRNFFESFEGDHLQFTMEEFDRWVHTYLRTKDP